MVAVGEALRHGIFRTNVSYWAAYERLVDEAVQRIPLATYLTLGAKTMPLQVYYYLYQGNWFDTAVAATLMTIPVLILSAFLQHYLRETSLAGVMR